MTKVSIDRHRHAGRQSVVVAELEPRPGRPLVAAVLDQLAHADAVVLVEDRHHPELEQAHQRGPHAQRPVAVGQVLLDEQHLGRLDPELAEQLGVERHQVALPDRRAGLAQPQRIGPPGQAEHPLAHADRAAADHDHLATLTVQVARRLDQARQPPERQAGLRMGHDPGPEFDYDPPRRGHVPPIHRTTSRPAPAPTMIIAPARPTRRCPLIAGGRYHSGPAPGHRRPRARRNSRL
nr:hypothetical protein [Nannocystis pusilla]